MPYPVAVASAAIRIIFGGMTLAPPSGRFRLANAREYVAEFCRVTVVVVLGMQRRVMRLRMKRWRGWLKLEVLKWVTWAGLGWVKCVMGIIE